MTSLGEAYGDSRWNGRDPRWISIGAGSFVAGVVAIVLAIGLVATPLGDVLGLTGTFEAREPAGVLAGLGVPAMLLGVVAVLPSSRRQGVGVVAGAVLCLAGVGLFTYAYPWMWPPAEPAMAFETTMTYFLGAVLAFGSVFSTVASYRVRNNPQGTVRMELKRQGETKTVTVPREQYREYKRAMRGDGGEQTQVISEIESKFEE
jgi:GNAT superfamily N-acetyltransferase